MTIWRELGKTGELAEGTMKEGIIEGQGILLAKVGDRYYATDNRYPHMGGQALQREPGGNSGHSPRHGSQFDLSNGRIVRWLKTSGLISTVSKALKRPGPLVVYKVSVEDDRILMEIQPQPRKGAL